MSLVGFKAKNHPQQVAKDEVDDRGTPWEVFNPLHERFRFTVDVAAAHHNAKLPKYYTKLEDGLESSWYASRVWCNPPYSNIAPWVEKAWSEFQQGCEFIVMLLPANRTEQKWWQQLVEPAIRERHPRFRVEFLPGRMRFDRPGAVIGPKGDRPPFGVCLLIWGTE